MRFWDWINDTSYTNRGIPLFKANGSEEYDIYMYNVSKVKLQSRTCVCVEIYKIWTINIREPKTKTPSERHNERRRIDTFSGMAKTNSCIDFRILNSSFEYI